MDPVQRPALLLQSLDDRLRDRGVDDAGHPGARLVGQIDVVVAQNRDDLDLEL